MTPTQQKAMDLDDLKDRLVAISDAIANQDDREAQAIIRTTLAALAERKPLFKPLIDQHPGLAEELAEQADDKAVNMAPLSDEPNWRHPKIQGLIGSEARLRIQVDLIWRILEDQNQEFGPSDMEYWDTLHDKLKSTLAAHGIKGD